MKKSKKVSVITGLLATAAVAGSVAFVAASCDDKASPEQKAFVAKYNEAGSLLQDVKDDQNAYNALSAVIAEASKLNEKSGATAQEYKDLTAKLSDAITKATVAKEALAKEAQKLVGEYPDKLKQAKAIIDSKDTPADVKNELNSVYSAQDAEYKAYLEAKKTDSNATYPFEEKSKDLTYAISLANFKLAKKSFANVVEQVKGYVEGLTQSQYSAVVTKLQKASDDQSAVVAGIKVVTEEQAKEDKNVKADTLKQVESKTNDVKAATESLKESLQTAKTEKANIDEQANKAKEQDLYTANAELAKVFIEKYENNAKYESVVNALKATLQSTKEAVSAQDATSVQINGETAKLKEALKTADVNRAMVDLNEAVKNANDYSAELSKKTEAAEKAAEIKTTLDAKVAEAQKSANTTSSKIEEATRTLLADLENAKKQYNLARYQVVKEQAEELIKTGLKTETAKTQLKERITVTESFNETKDANSSTIDHSIELLIQYMEQAKRKDVQADYDKVAAAVDQFVSEHSDAKYATINEELSDKKANTDKKVNDAYESTDKSKFNESLQAIKDATKELQAALDKANEDVKFLPYTEAVAKASEWMSTAPAEKASALLEKVKQISLEDHIFASADNDTEYNKEATPENIQEAADKIAKAIEDANKELYKSLYEASKEAATTFKNSMTDESAQTKLNDAITAQEQTVDQEEKQTAANYKAAAEALIKALEVAKLEEATAKFDAKKTEVEAKYDEFNSDQEVKNSLKAKVDALNLIVHPEPAEEQQEASKPTVEAVEQATKDLQTALDQANLEKALNAYNEKVNAITKWAFNTENVAEDTASLADAKEEKASSEESTQPATSAENTASTDSEAEQPQAQPAAASESSATTEENGSSEPEAAPAAEEQNKGALADEKTYKTLIARINSELQDKKQEVVKILKDTQKENSAKVDEINAKTTEVEALLPVYKTRKAYEDFLRSLIAAKKLAQELSPKEGQESAENPYESILTELQNSIQQENESVRAVENQTEENFKTAKTNLDAAVVKAKYQKAKKDYDTLVEKVDTLISQLPEQSSGKAKLSTAKQTASDKVTPTEQEATDFQTVIDATKELQKSYDEANKLKDFYTEKAVADNYSKDDLKDPKYKDIKKTLDEAVKAQTQIAEGATSTPEQVSAATEAVKAAVEQAKQDKALLDAKDAYFKDKAEVQKLIASLPNETNLNVLKSDYQAQLDKITEGEANFQNENYLSQDKLLKALLDNIKENLVVKAYTSISQLKDLIKRFYDADNRYMTENQFSENYRSQISAFANDVVYPLYDKYAPLYGKTDIDPLRQIVAQNMLQKVVDIYNDFYAFGVTSDYHYIANNFDNFKRLNDYVNEWYKMNPADVTAETPLVKLLGVSTDEFYFTGKLNSDSEYKADMEGKPAGYQSLIALKAESPYNLNGHENDPQWLSKQIATAQENLWVRDGYIKLFGAEDKTINDFLAYQDATRNVDLSDQTLPESTVSEISAFRAIYYTIINENVQSLTLNKKYINLFKQANVEKMAAFLATATQGHQNSASHEEDSNERTLQN
ncbi:hypothetical protein [[Mycoplasma] gypis]|uniref:Lipoprotein n=1 Tax=[Mycoplasma] gypis TaxID=92404 RepID=A0ABZ2RR27_9BACT|nr:hypothetical protein [[Mycoplasma] gypis]MBN0919369.1 hypothetical protein [[Mycoplasma] gypis]